MYWREVYRQALNREWIWCRSSFWHWGMISVIPLVFGLIVWCIFSVQTGRHLQIGLWDQDNTSLTRQITRYLQADPGLRISQEYHSEESVLQALRSGKVWAVLMIPEDATKKIKSGRSAILVLHQNTQFGTHAPLIIKEINAVIRTISAGIQVNIAVKRGSRFDQAINAVMPMQVALVQEYNLLPDYQLYLGASIIAALLHIIALMTGAFIFGRELRDATLEEWLSPQSEGENLYRSARILAKLTPSAVSLCTLAGFFTLMFSHASHQSISDFLWLWVGLTSLLWFCLTLGGVLSLLTLSMPLGVAIASFIAAPAFAFSGVGFPRLAMSTSARFWADLLPFTHYIHMQLGMILRHRGYFIAAPVVACFVSAIILTFLPLIFLSKRALAHPEKWVPYD